MAENGVMQNDKPVAPVSFDTIVVPIDFSEHSTKALRYAMAFARRFDSRLVLVSVIETALPTYDLGYMSSTVLEWDKQVKEQTAEKLAIFAAERIDAAIDYSCFTPTGEPTEEILAITKQEKADLIVMGTHGRTGLKHMFLGSVAEKTIRCAPCPVLVVRIGGREMVTAADEHAEVKLDEIIVPLDFSAGSFHALHVAESVARVTGAKLNLLHVVPFHYPVGEYDALEYPGLEAEMMEAGRARLAKLSEQENASGIPVRTAAVRGSPRNEILQFAEQQKGDLVVIGTRGLTGLAHLLLGSTAEYVVRHGMCAVLTVPSPREASLRKKKQAAEPSVTTV